MHNSWIHESQCDMVMSVHQYQYPNIHYVTLTLKQNLKVKCLIQWQCMTHVFSLIISASFACKCTILYNTGHFLEFWPWPLYQGQTGSLHGLPAWHQTFPGLWRYQECIYIGFILSTKKSHGTLYRAGCHLTIKQRRQMHISPCKLTKILAPLAASASDQKSKWRLFSWPSSHFLTK